MTGLAKNTWHYTGYGLLILVAAAPLTLGAVAPWAWASLAVLCGLLMLVAAGANLLDYAAPRLFWFDLRGPAVLCAAAFVWVLFQLSPLPAAWQHPVWDATRDILGSAQGAISLNPAEGTMIITRWLMYAAIFLLAYVWGRDARRVMIALNVLVYVAAAYALYALVMLFTGHEVALWVTKPMYHGDATGPFINRNSFATYCGAMLCVAIALLLRRVMRESAGAGAREFWRRALGTLLGASAPMAAVVLTLFVALLMTHSRAGLASFLVGLAALLFLLRLAGLLRGRMFFWAVGMMAAALAGMFMLSGEGVLTRLTSVGEPARPELYALMMNALADRPWLGAGLGSFPQIFQIYRTEDFPAYFFTERGHQVYLELMLELGIPAALCLFVGLGWVWWRVAASTAMAIQHRTIPAATAAAIVVMAAHSLIDFPLQIPAITMLFALLLGLGLAQARE